MGVAGKLQTQTDSFWRDEYEVSDADLDLVTSQILESGRPQKIESPLFVYRTAPLPARKRSRILTCLQRRCLPT